jgi:uncharacterized repeat protein (TIGR03843 family)
MVQLWCEPDPDLDAVDIVPAGAEPAGFLKVLDAHDNYDRPVSLVHEDTPALRRMAVFDAIVNNTDRKGGHVLAMPDGHRFGVDHGVSFHVENKLRTVLWGWTGAVLSDEAVDVLGRLSSGLRSSLGGALREHLTGAEVARVRGRVRRLLENACFPEPGTDWPSVPWPPM